MEIRNCLDRSFLISMMATMMTILKFIEIFQTTSSPPTYFGLDEIWLEI